MIAPSYKKPFLVAVLIVGLGSVVGCNRIGKTILKTAVTDATVRTVAHSSQDKVRTIFAAANAQCPIRIDAFTTLEKIEMIDDQNVEYHYSVNQQGSKLVEKLNKQLLQQVAIKQIQGNPVAVAVAERGLKVRHVYQDESGRVLLSYVIDKASLEEESDAEDAGDAVGADQSNPFAVITEESAERTNPAESTGDPELNGEVDVAAEVVQENDWVPTDLTPEKKDEPQPWRIQENPFFEA